MSIFEKLVRFVQRVFKTNLEIFLEALKLSPNAQGYVSGSITELLLVSGTSGSSERTQATPRKDEFNVIAIDIVLRYPEHKFLFANPQNLESSGDDPNHLQQNYVMGFVFTDEQGNATLNITDDWYEYLNDVYDTLDPEDSVNERDMQIDNRYMVLNENDE
jgi:hypothetical protein